MTAPPLSLSLACAAALLGAVPALAQTAPPPAYEPPPSSMAPAPAPAPAPPATSPAPGDAAAGAPDLPPEASLPPPPPPNPTAPVLLPPPPPRTGGPELDGHLRSGPFLSGPGSLTFLAHHTLLGAAGGFATQGVGNGFRLDEGGREAMLIGTLVGAGLGFGVSTWWQFNHWIGLTTANFGIINSFISGMFFAGLTRLITHDATALTWSAFAGMELGAWLTATVGGGDLPLSDGLLVASGGLWGLIYGGLVIAIINFSGPRFPTLDAALTPMMLAAGAGAGLAAISTLRFHPSAAQVMRADLFGGGVGAAVLLLSAAVIGSFQSPTPYVLSLLGSVGAVAAVSIFWEETAERPRAEFFTGPRKDQPYRCAWW